MLFCREFENVVNRAFLVLIFLGGKLVGANFYAFCNYGSYNHIQESLSYSQVHSNCSLATYHVQEEAYQVSRMTIAIATKFWTFALSRRLPLMN